MKRSLPVLLCTLVLVRAAHAGAPLTIEEAVAMALRKHPQIAEAKEDVAGARARAGKAEAAYYPQLALIGDWTKGRSYLTALERVRSVEVESAVVQLKQTIYDFGRTSGTVAAARTYSEAAQKNVKLAGLDLGLRVKAGFYRLLAARRELAANRDIVAAREAVHRQALEFFRQGLRAKVDVARSEANLYQAKTALIAAENGVELARVELAAALGLPTLGDLDPVEPSLTAMPHPDREAVRREALENRAELRQLALYTEAARAELKAARAGHLPVLAGAASYGYADRDFPPTGTIWGVGVNLTLPLFSGFHTTEGVREANALVHGSAARLENMRLQVIKEVEAARLAVEDAAARLSSTDKEVAAAEENRALAEGRYQEGVGGIIEVTEAQSLALAARTSHIRARYDYQVALAVLDRSAGRP